MYQPHFRIDGSTSIPLSSCNREQTEQLLDQLVDRRGILISLGKVNVLKQIDWMIQQCQERIELFDSSVEDQYGNTIGVLGDFESVVKEEPVEKRPSFLDDEE